MTGTHLKLMRLKLSIRMRKTGDVSDSEVASGCLCLRNDIEDTFMDTLSPLVP